MKIEYNKMVSLIYELREDDSEGRIIEALDESRPLKFIFGTGRLLPVFESNISLLEAGDKFTFALSPDSAYGEKREEMIINLPVSVFETDRKINEDICMVGNEVPMTDSEGNALTGIINEVTDTYVRMDFNHPMAGLNLFFSGKIIEVREPTENELAATMYSCSGCSGNAQSNCSGGCG
jgi:FKBP-type peptidyl-prolyl cis-trans isomerase SlyD